ncbi:FGGY family carbohydrate kinase [Neosynechococcus sphagnicola]|uniref:FGGY family carbohydrate kinase n=1 Tax=Neosynechococcus sphagnicola TaxID=1501145 RepID=UPI0019553337|nr:FGGY family carbohydrate kinase [Neosynechococcus sphagnicola]
MIDQQQLVIGIDCSTTACKAIAWNREGKAIAKGMATYPLLKPQANWYEQDASQWWNSTCNAIQQLLAEIDKKR